MSGLGYLTALGATLALEGIVVAMLAPRRERGSTLAACAGGNLITHSLAAGVPALASLGWLGVELLAVLVEAVIYRRAAATTWRQALGLAAASNALSAAAALSLG